MKIIITGGGGFLGSQLAATLLNRGELTSPSGSQEPIDELVLIDARFVTPQNDTRMQQIVGDISNRDVINEAIGSAYLHRRVCVYALFHEAVECINKRIIVCVCIA